MQQLKFKNHKKSYEILFGENIINILPQKIKLSCPKTKKIALIFDRKVPAKFKGILLKIKKVRSTLFVF